MGEGVLYISWHTGELIKPEVCSEGSLIRVKFAFFDLRLAATRVEGWEYQGVPNRVYAVVQPGIWIQATSCHCVKLSVIITDARRSVFHFCEDDWRCPLGLCCFNVIQWQYIVYYVSLKFPAFGSAQCRIGCVGRIPTGFKPTTNLAVGVRTRYLLHMLMYGANIFESSSR